MRRIYLLTTLFLGLAITLIVGFTLVGLAQQTITAQAAPASPTNEGWTYTPTLEFDSGQVDYEFPLSDILTPTHPAVEPLRGDDYVTTTHPGLEFPVLSQQGTDWWGKFVYEVPLETISHTQEGDLFGALLLREVGQDAGHHWYVQSFWPGWGTSYSDARLGEGFIGGLGVKNCIVIQSPIVPSGYELGYCVIKVEMENDFQPYLMFETAKGDHTATLTTWKCNRVDVQDQRCPIPLRWQTILFPERGLSLSMDQSKVGLQGDVVTYTVTLTNTGGYTDTFTVDLTNSSSWYTWMTSQNPTLAAGQSVDFEVSVLIPGEALPGDSDVATVTATSQGDPNVGDSTLMTTSIPLPPPPEEYVLYIPLVVRP